MQNVTGKKPGGTSVSHRIAILIPYFGTVPWYFKFFNRSCQYNPDIDFIFLTDVDWLEDLAENIIVFRCSLREISQRFTEKFGFEINIVRPYKLCDLRPAFGLVFSDLIEGYDFWGYGDIDVVLGNIRSLITVDILNRHEIVTIRKTYIAGFFSLFRNNDKINNLFRKSKDYRKVFQEPVDYCFDECNWEWGSVQGGKDILELDSVIDSITHVIRNEERTGNISVYWHDMEVHPGRVVWDRGNLSSKDNETPLLCHFNTLTNLDYVYVPKWKTIPDRFYINSFYLSRYAPRSLAGLFLHCVLTTVRFVKRKLTVLNQYLQWLFDYLFASRRIDHNDVQHLTNLPGQYRFQQVVVNLFIRDRCLHGTVDDVPFRLLHKGAGKFVVAKYRFMDLFNVEMDIHFNEFISAHTIQATSSGYLKKYIFFKIS